MHQWVLKDFERADYLEPKLASEEEIGGLVEFAERSRCRVVLSAAMASLWHLLGPVNLNIE